MSLKLANVPNSENKGKNSKKRFSPCKPSTNYIQTFLLYMEKYISPYLFGFRKGHNTEQCLIVMLEIWKKALDEKIVAGAILTDLSKAFDCLNHDLLLAKLHTYGFDNQALNFIKSYLKGRKQRTKIADTCSSWNDIKYGVPEGSIREPLLFNIFLNDIFYFTKNTKIAGDNTPYTKRDGLDNLQKRLKMKHLFC